MTRSLAFTTSAPCDERMPRSRRIAGVSVTSCTSRSTSTFFAPTSGRSAGVTVTVSWRPVRCSTIGADSPTRRSSISPSQSNMLRKARPRLRRIWSPGRIPARAAGEPGTTLRTTTPDRSTSRGVLPTGCAMRMPIHGWRTAPCFSRSSATRIARLIGIAKPIPMLPPVGEKIDVLTPITCPSALTSGPPELPGLIDASVCSMSTYVPGPSFWPCCGTRFRPVALITPAVTLGSVLPSRNPYGLPMATAHSPIARSDDVPIGATGMFVAAIFSTARSFNSSMPTTFASYVWPSRMATLTFVAPATTCAFVTITPLACTMKPDPMPACVRRPPRPPPNIISNGSAGTCCTLSVCTVTTAGATFATASVMAVRREAGSADAACSARVGTVVAATGRCASDSAAETP